MHIPDGLKYCCAGQVSRLPTGPRQVPKTSKMLVPSRRDTNVANHRSWKGDGQGWVRDIIEAISAAYGNPLDSLSQMIQTVAERKKGKEMIFEIVLSFN